MKTTITSIRKRTLIEVRNDQSAQEELNAVIQILSPFYPAWNILRPYDHAAIDATGLSEDDMDDVQLVFINKDVKAYILLHDDGQFSTVAYNTSEYGSFAACVSFLIKEWAEDEDTAYILNKELEGLDKVVIPTYPTAPPKTNVPAGRFPHDMKEEDDDVRSSTQMAEHLKALSEAWKNVSTSWEQLIPEKAAALSKRYPFSESFDDLLFDVREWVDTSIAMLLAPPVVPANGDVSKMIWEVEGNRTTLGEMLADNSSSNDAFLDKELLAKIISMQIGETIGEGLNMATIKRIQ